MSICAASNCVDDDPHLPIPIEEYERVWAMQAQEEERIKEQMERQISTELELLSKAVDVSCIKDLLQESNGQYIPLRTCWLPTNAIDGLKTELYNEYINLEMHDGVTDITHYTEPSFIVAAQFIQNLEHFFQSASRQTGNTESQLREYIFLAMQKTVCDIDKNPVLLCNPLSIPNRHT